MIAGKFSLQAAARRMEEIYDSFLRPPWGGPSGRGRPEAGLS